MSKHPIENIAESHRTEAINWPLLLLTHAACVDEQLHVRETDSLRRFAEEWGASQVTKDAMTAIIEQDEEAPSAGKIASKIDIESREPTLRYLLYLSHVDGHHHPHERKLAKDVAREWRIGNETLRQMTDQAAELAKQTDFDEVGEDEDVELNFRERLLKTTEDHVPSGVIDTIVRIGPSRLSRKVDRARQRILLSGEDYEEALDECAEVARQDFDSAAETTREALDDFREVETDLAEQLERLEEKTSSESSATDEVKGQFAATAESLEEEVHSRMERLQSAFEARERAVGYFTIALMGRTKVGKSTLHATLTGQGWDSIGDGQQRKTRLNRVYEWRNIRIIDTPGIGAPGGKSDEEIAASVIDEADVVCYVLTNDSQQKSEFEFLKKLQGRAKPVVLLLNVKKNLKDERRLKRFLKNPDRLFQTDGHEERIRRYASEHLENDMFEIIPVQLLAAQLARQEDYNDITEKLMEASRFNDFLDFLRVSLIENGSIRRSQTFLGSTARDLAEMSKWLSSEQSKFEHLEATLDTKRGELLEELDEAKESAHRQIEGGIKDIFQDLHDTIPSFANENYDCSDEEVLQQRWQDHMTNTRIEERVNTRFEEVIVDYRDRVESAVEEIDQDIEKALAIEFDDANLSTKDVGVGIKRFLKIGGGALAIFLHPVAIGAAVFAQVAAWFLDKKTEKERKAIDAMISELRDYVSKSREAAVQKAFAEFNSAEKEIRRNLRDRFSLLQSVTKGFSESFGPANSSVNLGQEKLSSRFAARTVQWARSEPYTNGYELNERKIDALLTEWSHDPLDRELAIETPVSIRKDEGELQRAIQGKVTIETL